MTAPVKKIRKALELTQNELAKMLGVRRQMIWAYEKGHSMPRVETAKKLLALAKENNIDINAEDFFID